MLKFAVDNPPQFENPIDVLSIISPPGILARVCLPLLQFSYYYQSSGCSISDLIHSLRDTPIDASIWASNGTNSISWRTSSSSFDLRLNDFTMSHNSFASRYIEFKRHKPAKGSVEIDAFHTATVTPTNSNAKIDFDALLIKVFASSEVTVLLNTELPQLTPLGFVNVHEETAKSALEVSLAARCRPALLFEASHPISEELDSLPEFISLMHMNAVPDMSNSYVSNSCMFEYPEYLSNYLFSEDPYSVTVLLNVHPAVYNALLQSSECLSLIAKNGDQSVTTLKQKQNVYSWQ